MPTPSPTGNGEAMRTARWRAYLTDPEPNDPPAGVRIQLAANAGYDLITIAGWLRVSLADVQREINVVTDAGWL